jgi:hypothetical protein
MSTAIETQAHSITNVGQGVLLRELLERSGWIFVAMIVLQAAFALIVLGVKLPFSNYWVLPLMMLGLFPLLGPNRRLLQSLPIDTQSINRLQWLYNGGLVAIVATAVNALTLVGVLLLDIPFSAANALLLILGTPAAVGLFMPLRRWTTAGVKPENQNRPPLLANYLAVPLLLITQTLIRIDQLAIVSVIAVTLLASGWILLLRYLLAPVSYNAWIEKSTSSHPAAQAKRPTGPFVLPLYAVVAIASFCTLLSVAAAFAPSSPEIAIAVAVMQTVWALGMLPSIKVMRSVPRSLTRCAGSILTRFLGLPLASLLTYATTISMLHSNPWTQALSFVLPVLGLIAPLAPVAVRHSLRRNGKPSAVVRVYIVLVMITMIVTPWLIRLTDLNTLLAQCIALALIAISFAWLRHEIRHGAMMYRFQSAPLGAWSA